VGSANVSRAALTERLKWRAKIAENALPYAWRQIKVAFETHWEDNTEFVRLQPFRVERFAEARQSRHLFASAASWHSRGLDRRAPDHFDYVVLDKAHHAAPATHQEMLGHLRSEVLLGLIATPERVDDRDIRSDFGEP
jgi:hypothetical protein